MWAPEVRFETLIFNSQLHSIKVNKNPYTNSIFQHDQRYKNTPVHIFLCRSWSCRPIDGILPQGVWGFRISLLHRKQAQEKTHTQQLVSAVWLTAAQVSHTPSIQHPFT